MNYDTHASDKKQEDKPLVSVIIPVFNRQKEIIDIITSLNLQSYKNFEVIFVDDYSKVALSEFLSQLKDTIKFVFSVHRNSRNRGVSFSRNQGVILAKGQFIAFLDSDDRWFPRKLEMQVEQCSHLDMVFSMCKTQIIKSAYTEVLPKKSLRDYSCGESYLFEHGNFAQVSSFFLSRKLALTLSFSESINQYEDFLYFITAFNNASEIVFVDETLVVWNDAGEEQRLSKKKNYGQVREFLHETSGTIQQVYLDCFYLRFVMPYYFYSNITHSFKVTFTCIRLSEMSLKTIFWLLCRSILGDAIVGSLRKVVKNEKNS